MSETSAVAFEVAAATSRGLFKVFGKDFSALPLKVKESKRYSETVTPREQATLTAAFMQTRRRDKKANATYEWLKKNDLRTTQLGDLISVLSQPSMFKREGGGTYLLEIKTMTEPLGEFKILGEPFGILPLSLAEDESFEGLYLDADVSEKLLPILQRRTPNDITQDWLENLTGEQNYQILGFLRNPPLVQEKKGADGVNSKELTPG